jgi:Family of unknown function (DUF6335)
MKKRVPTSKTRTTRAKPRAAKAKRRPGTTKARTAPPKRRTTSGTAKPRKSRPKRSPGSAAPLQGAEDAGRVTRLHDERLRHHETSPTLSGGDIDADWVDAEGSGEESVGGSVATPDQDVVDEIGRALGVEQTSTQPVTSSEEILRERAAHRWELEREASAEDDRRER